MLRVSLNKCQYFWLFLTVAYGPFQIHLLILAQFLMKNISFNEPTNFDGTKTQNGTESEDTDGMDLVPPQHLFSDYVEIAYLGLVICAGLALNISVLKRLLLERRRAKRGNKGMNGFLLLKLNLNVSDILILLIHASGKLGWLITYEWRFGDFLCRLFNLLSMFTLYLSSNIVICIALDRLFTVLTARRMDLGQRKLNLVRLMLTLAWSFSLLFSLPQLFVWTTYNPFKDTISRGWVQCTDIWSINRYEQNLSGGQSENKNSSDGPAEENSGSNWTQLILGPIIQNTYELSHLFLVFYGPLIALVVCYVVISSRLIRFAANNPCSTAHTVKLPQSKDYQPTAVTYSSAERRQKFKGSAARTMPSMRMYAPGKWRRKSQHNNQLALLHHAPLMDIVELSSTRAEEPSNSAPNDTKVVSTYQYQTVQHEAPQQSEAVQGTMTETLLVNCSRGNSAISLPAFSNCAEMRPSVSAGQLNNGTAMPLPAFSHGATPSHSHHSISCCSSSMSSSHDLKRFGDQPVDRERRRQILSRIRDSFRESFGKRNVRRRSRLGDTELTNMQSLSTNSLFDGMNQCDRDRNGTLPGFCAFLVQWMDRLKRAQIWNLCRNGHGKQRMYAKNSTSSSIGARHFCSTDILEGAFVSSSSQPRPPSSSSNKTHQNGDVSSAQSFHKSPWISRNHSVRSSYSTTISTLLHPNDGTDRPRPVPSGNLLWRHRSKAFRTTLLVILVHILLWSPYNVYALMKHVNERLYERMNEQANVLKDMQFLITLINPFLYGFGRISGGGGGRAAQHPAESRANVCQIHKTIFAVFYSLIIMNDTTAGGQQQLHPKPIATERELLDIVEIVYLSLSVCIGTLLNSMAVFRLVRYSKRPSANAKQHCPIRPFYMNAFAMFKFNLAISDFAILFIHALGKMVWLLSYRWLFGDFGCRLYQFLSAFAYYSNSNVVVAIGLDRLKVVYSGQVQGASSSTRRVRIFLTIAWALAAICALPQLFFWTNFELGLGWSQCTTIWQIAEYSRASNIISSKNLSMAAMSSTISQQQQQHADYSWSASANTQLVYEILHQVIVFVIPLISLTASYVLIVVRVLRYSLRPPPSSNLCAYSSFNFADQWVDGGQPGADGEAPERAGRNFLQRLHLLRYSGDDHLLQPSSSTSFSRTVQHQLSTTNVTNSFYGPPSSPPTITANNNSSSGKCRHCTAPPPSPNTIVTNGNSMHINNISGNKTTKTFTKFPYFVADDYANNNSSPSQQPIVESAADRLLLLTSINSSTTAQSMKEQQPNCRSSCKRLSIELYSFPHYLHYRPKRCSLNLVNFVPSAVAAHDTSFSATARLLMPRSGVRPQCLPQSVSDYGQCVVAARHRILFGGKPSSFASTAAPISPLWRRQMRSKVFIRSLLIVIAHCAFWLPYNLLNLLRFTNESLYTQLMDRGALLVEDLIVMNSLINPVLYGYGK
uniref:G-protein coupled receptors family 1 profile domain-containing protein n=1 Tax=Globodera rostochiensis TaxID=31243 RepID=A0A914GTI1_GLORO